MGLVPLSSGRDGPFPQLHLGPGPDSEPDPPDAVHLLQLPGPVGSWSGQSHPDGSLTGPDLQL